MKRYGFFILLFWCFSLVPADLWAQGPTIQTQALCWTTPSDPAVDSTLIGYYIYTGRADEPLLINYLNAAGETVDVSAGGTIRVGQCDPDFSALGSSTNELFVYRLSQGEDYSLPLDTLDKYERFFFYGSGNDELNDTATISLPTFPDNGSDRYIGKRLFFHLQELTADSTSAVILNAPGDPSGSRLRQYNCYNDAVTSQNDTFTVTTEGIERLIVYTTVPRKATGDYFRECPDEGLLSATNATAETFFYEATFGEDYALPLDTFTKYQTLVIHAKPTALDTAIITFPLIGDVDSLKGKNIYVYGDGGEATGTVVVRGTESSRIVQVDCSVPGRFIAPDTINTELSDPRLLIYRTVANADYTRVCEGGSVYTNNGQSTVAEALDSLFRRPAIEICKTDRDPNLIAALDTIDQRVDCSIVRDTANNITYEYDASLPVGSRWLQAFSGEFGEVKYVSKSAGSLSGDGSLANPYSDPWTAKNNASVGDIIYVLDGNFTVDTIGSGSDCEISVTNTDNADLFFESCTYYFAEGTSITSNIDFVDYWLFKLSDSQNSMNVYGKGVLKELVKGASRLGLVRDTIGSNSVNVNLKKFEGGTLFSIRSRSDSNSLSYSLYADTVITHEQFFYSNYGIGNNVNFHSEIGLWERHTSGDPILLRSGGEVSLTVQKYVLYPKVGGGGFLQNIFAIEPLGVSDATFNVDAVFEDYIIDSTMNDYPVGNRFNIFRIWTDTIVDSRFSFKVKNFKNGYVNGQAILGSGGTWGTWINSHLSLEIDNLLSMSQGTRIVNPMLNVNQTGINSSMYFNCRNCIIGGKNVSNNSIYNFPDSDGDIDITVSGNYKLDGSHIFSVSTNSTGRFHFSDINIQSAGFSSKIISGADSTFLKNVMIDNSEGLFYDVFDSQNGLYSLSIEENGLRAKSYGDAGLNSGTVSTYIGFDSDGRLIESTSPIWSFTTATTPSPSSPGDVHYNTDDNEVKISKDGLTYEPLVPKDTIIHTFPILKYNGTDTIADQIGFEEYFTTITPDWANRKVVAFEITTTDTVSTDLYLQLYQENIVAGTSASPIPPTTNFVLPQGQQSIRFTTADTEIPVNGIEFTLGRAVYAAVTNGSAAGSTSYVATEGANGLYITFYLIEN